MTRPTSLHRLLALTLCALALGCEPAPTPTGLTALLRVELSGAGVVQEVSAALVDPSEVPRYATPVTDGSLTVEVLDGDEVVWTGAQHAPLYLIDETFGPSGITGTRERVESTVAFLAVPDDGRAELPLRLRFAARDADVQTMDERVVALDRSAGEVGAAGAGLTDIGGARAALCTAAQENAHCPGPEQFCLGELPNGSFQCRDEACLPDATWDGMVTEVQPGDAVRILFIPLGFAGPDEFEAYIEEILENLHSRVDWFSDNQGQIGFSVWRQLCEYDVVPTLDDTASLYAWLEGLEAETQLLPSFDKYIVVSNADTCRGRAAIFGRYSALTSCMSDIDHGADDVAHELGHLVAGLTDEYDYGGSDTCAAGTYPLTMPNLAPLDDPHWFCDSSTGEVYAGRECGTIGGGVVGAFRGPANSCMNDIARPCSSSMMSANWDNQFDPVGYAAMSFAVETGGWLGFEDCDAGCDSDCSAIGAGECGLNGCFQLCDSCDTGESCRGAQEIGYLCAAACDPSFNSCRSSFGFDFCHGDTALTTDGGCSGYRIAGCDNGSLVPMGCVM